MKSQSLLTEQIASSSISNSQVLDVQVPTPAKTSLRAATFAMMASAMGSGIFNLPYRVTEVGLCMYMLYVTMSGLFSYLGCVLLQRLIQRRGFKSYAEVSRAAFGSWLAAVTQVSLIFFPWAVSVCFQVLMAKFIIEILADNFHLDLYTDRNTQTYNSTGNRLRIILNISLISVNFILIQMRDIRILQRISIIGVIVCGYNMLALLVLAAIGFTHNGIPALEYKSIFSLDWSLVRWFVFDGNALSTHTQAVASILYCYINHQMVFPTCNNLQRPTKGRLNRVFVVSNMSEMGIYLLIATSGYLLLVPNQAVLPIGPMVLTIINTWPMALGKCLITISTFLVLPLFVFASRSVCHQLLSLAPSTRNHYLTSIALTVLGCLVATLFDRVNTYFGFLGGVAVLMAGGIPALCYWKLLMREGSTWGDWVMVLLCGAVAGVGVVGAVMSVLAVVG